MLCFFSCHFSDINLDPPPRHTFTSRLPCMTARFPFFFVNLYTKLRLLWAAGDSGVFFFLILQLSFVWVPRAACCGRAEWGTRMVLATLLLCVYIDWTRVALAWSVLGIQQAQCRLVVSAKYILNITLLCSLVPW